MRPSEILRRRATDFLSSRYNSGIRGFPTIPKTVVDSATLDFLLLYIDELFDRGMLPMPGDPHGPGIRDPQPPDPETPETPATLPMEPTRARLYSTISDRVSREGFDNVVTSKLKTAIVEDIMNTFDWKLPR